MPLLVTNQYNSLCVNRPLDSYDDILYSEMEDFAITVTTESDMSKFIVIDIHGQIL